MFMLFYWIYYNKIIINLTVFLYYYYFFYFGILSAIFLLLHVFFLGWSFENEFLSKLRRTFVVFFILFEVLAQAFLIKKILLIKNKISDYLNSIIVYSKLLFVLSEPNKNLWLAARNLKNVELTTANCLNLEQLLKATQAQKSVLATNASGLDQVIKRVFKPADMANDKYSRSAR